MTRPPGLRFRRMWPCGGRAVHGETKTERSRRTLGLPQLAVEALCALRQAQDGERLAAEQGWQDTGLVFTTHPRRHPRCGQRPEDVQTGLHRGRGRGRLDAPRAAHLVRQPAEPPRVSIEEITRLAGHASIRTTEVVYRRELRPVITTGAEIMDELFSES